MRYGIYSTITGQIVRVVNCAPNILPLQIQQDESSIEMPDGMDNKHYVRNGVLVDMPLRPTDHHVFSWTTKTWDDPRTLADFKRAKWEHLKSFRDWALVAPLVTQFGTFDADAKSQKSITDAIMLLQTLEAMGTPETVDFTLADNTTATLTLEQMVTVGLMLGSRTQGAYAQARTRRAQIDAASTVADVEAVEWS